MTTRRKLTTLDKLHIMTRQAVCPDCGERLGALTDCEFDHQHQLAMGGTDTLDNLFAKHVKCHAKKTVKDAKARAKVRHIAKKSERFQGPPMGESVGIEKPERKSKWPTRKLQSRNTLEKRI